MNPRLPRSCSSLRTELLSYLFFVSLVATTFLI
jgi:hypothetical protein